jgi:hypothetical protein
VLFIHAASVFISLGDKGAFVYLPVAALWRMCGFAAQGFVFIAGMRYMLSAQKKSRGVLSYYLCGIRRIVPLYLLWCVIYYAYDIVVENSSFGL